MQVRQQARRYPDRRGRFGPYGGRYVPETLVGALEELAQAYASSRRDADFRSRLRDLLRTYVGRPTPITHAARLSEHAGGAQIYLKREDLAHTGAHKINNAIGQALLARAMGKERVVAETGAGQHGVASAAACALLGLRCVVYKGVEDMARQQANVVRMRLLGAEVRPVGAGAGTLKEAVSEAMRDWVADSQHTYYLLGSVVGPHPYPLIVRDFQSVIGREARRQMLQLGGLPDYVVACVGGGSNAIGIFYPFLRDDVRLLGVEGGGAGMVLGAHAASLCAGRPGVLHGSLSYLLSDGEGNILPTASVAPGLDYPGVGPEHSYLKDSGRVRYLAVSDAEALSAFRLLSETEGIIPALESAHAVYAAVELARVLPVETRVLVNLSGRGDKDLAALPGQVPEEAGA